jgi:hypothetical protein
MNYHLELKDKTIRIVKLEAFVNENKNYLKLIEKEKRTIEQLLQNNNIKYQESMSKINSALKFFTKEVDVIRKCYHKDFKNLSEDIQNAKDPLKKVLDKVTVESGMIMRELDRTQRNNRTLIDDYLKIESNKNNVNSNVNLFWSISNEDLSASNFPQRSMQWVNFPRVCPSVMTTSVTGEDASDMFRNTFTSFQNYKKDIKVKLKNQSRLAELVPAIREVRSVTRVDRYKPSTSSPITESSYAPSDTPMKPKESPIPGSLELSPAVKTQRSRKTWKVELFRREKHKSMRRKGTLREEHKK